MISKSIVFTSEDIYNKAKAQAIMEGKNLMTPKDGQPSWAEEAFAEKLERSK